MHIETSIGLRNPFRTPLGAALLAGCLSAAISSGFATTEKFESWTSSDRLLRCVIVSILCSTAQFTSSAIVFGRAEKLLGAIVAGILTGVVGSIWNCGLYVTGRFWPQHVGFIVTNMLWISVANRIFALILFGYLIAVLFERPKVARLSIAMALLSIIPCVLFSVLMQAAFIKNPTDMSFWTDRNFVAISTVGGILLSILQTIMPVIPIERAWRSK